MPNNVPQYQVIASERFSGDVQAATRFLTIVSTDAAVALEKKLREVVESLQTFPMRFERLQTKVLSKEHLYRGVIENRYLLIFSITGQTVTLRRFLDARQGLIHLL